MSRFSRELVCLAPALGDSELRVFRSVPPHQHGVAVLQGLVVVYETDWRDMEDGGFYVV